MRYFLPSPLAVNRSDSAGKYPTMKSSAILLLWLRRG